MKKIIALLLTAMLLLSLAACGGEGKPVDTDTPPSGTEIGDKEDEGELKFVITQYGSNPDYEVYTATIYCPEGAYFDEDEYAEFQTDGYLNDFWVFDDVREYDAYSTVYWSRDIYRDGDELPQGYGIVEQLYFEGKVAPETEAEYPEYEQKVTDLGFKWEDKDVKLIETTYTSADGYDYSEVFVGVEYTHYFWRVKDGGEVEDGITAPGLFGFTVNGWDITVDQYAWIAGQLFGVESGRTWKLESEGEENTPAPADVDVSLLYGTWLDPESSWEDTYVFNPDGTGVLVSGPQYPFTYELSGSTLTLTFEEDDEESFEVSVDNGQITFIDNFGNKIKLQPSDEEVEIHDSDALAAALIGYWLDEAAGNNESFTFKENERGIYTWKDETYEFSYTLSSSENILDIRYDDGDHSTFYLEFDGDTMILDKDWKLIRQ